MEAVEAVALVLGAIAVVWIGAEFMVLCAKLALWMGDKMWEYRDKKDELLKKQFEEKE